MTHRQILAGIVLSVAGITLLTLLILPHWFWHPLGICTGNNCGYQFWSGVAGSFATSSGIWTGAALFYWKHQCHHHGCLSVGLHTHPHHGLLCRRHFQAAGGQIPGKHYPLETLPEGET